MPSIQEQIAAIQERYKPEIEALESRGKQLEQDFHKPDSWEAVINVDFDVTWGDQTFSFDVPTVTMRTQTLSLDIPEVFPERQTIVFHTPSVRMVDRKVGQYPEWHGPFKIVWKDIIISVPEPFMQEQRIIFDLPSVRMKRQEFKLDLPEFKMETIKVVVGLPQITVRKVSAETAKIKERGEALKAEGEKLAARMKSEIEAVVGGLTAVSGQSAAVVKQSIGAEYDGAINALQKGIDELVAKGVDPIKVPAESGEVNLRKKLADLVAARDQAVNGVPSPLPLAA
ncbi:MULTISPECIES: hypothetical protein [unclassified Neorhizobium]|uniref:hypothetical protein n=1 Tax=unclassified Neorhizobium TaxID=2629175 RepID=UPI001FF570E5|nr:MULTISPECIES: hypothetical protein [unclassified Neorhizobium]MCJ9668543.1 hypothetical protein [Neorhizobium sp. SHOUNA12B]MCJ9744246.1 hypothetical protein [Neorhizobium sp. SHOUNA12A]